ncbi:MAG: helicase-related protein [Gemmataceae bacterium]
MLRLSELKSGQSIMGLEPAVVTTVVAVVPIADGAVQLVYKMPNGSLKERMIGVSDEENISLATAERPWAFDGDGADFRLACEAKRIDFAFLFDPMMAVHTSNVEPLPHQITAVYESMLPRTPLRFVLADDPGAGKTIMAGLYISELIMRADVRRALIVAPGSLVEQWRDELYEKFGLEFSIYCQALEQATPNANPFEACDQLIVRLDQMARNDGLREKLCAAGWDLVVFDEAHKLAAHYYGTKIEKTGRFNFAEELGRNTRHLLLMTATPHNGKEEDYQLFMSLLDSDRFYGKFRDGVHKVDASDLMRRMIKEELVKFDGRPLFPERRAHTVNYPLSSIEAGLYESVTKYVQTEMGKADELDGKRKSSVGFALTGLQRRLASSPEAIFQSLKRRKHRLEIRVRDEKLGMRGRQVLAETLHDVPEDEDDLNATEQENLEEALIDAETAAETVAELEDEIRILHGLEEQAKAVVASGQDRKWEELSKLLQNTPEMRDANDRQRKIIIFSEHRDTLNYLHGRIADVLGKPDAIAIIHGGTKRDERLKTQAQFRSDPDLCVLIATDAAGEGVNLQCAHLMVNYDLPWNPNRLEQRFGRIHRIGQTEVCHLWSLVAKETREGAVYHRLLEKLEVQSTALKGRVFNVLGDVFEEMSLKQLMIEAIRYGDQPEVRDKLKKTVEHAFDPSHLKSLLERNALAQETMSPERLFKVRDDMEKAEARRLQPFFVRSFFLQAFSQLGGSIYPRESERFEITHVPSAIRERERRLTGRNRREQEPILKRYDRIAFSKDAIKLLDRPGTVPAVLMHPGHPLMLAVSDIILEQHANLLRQGAILVDPKDEGGEPWLLFLLTHEVKSGDGAVLSKRMQFVRVNADGSTANAGWAPHLDLEPLDAAERPRLQGLLASPWIRADQEARAVGLAAATLVPEHFKEVADRRISHVDKTLAAVHERLTKEINFLSDRWLKLKEDLAAGKDVRVSVDNARKTLADLEGRLENRKRELQAMRHVVNGTPVVLGGALVVPIGLLQQLRGEAPAPTTADAIARSRIEDLAMKAVWRAEEARGCRVVDVSNEKCGWDLTSYPPAQGDFLPEPRHIEVKGRAKDATTITVTSNEIRYAFNQAEKFVLAVVFVNDDDTTVGPHFIRKPFDSEPGWGVSSINYHLNDLLTRAGAHHICPTRSRSGRSLALQESRQRTESTGTRSLGQGPRQAVRYHRRSGEVGKHY